jgi:hypothetical protein
MASISEQASDIAEEERYAGYEANKAIFERIEKLLTGRHHEYDQVTPTSHIPFSENYNLDVRPSWQISILLWSRQNR